MSEREMFIHKMTLAAVAAIGRQHGYLVRWAVAKAVLECGGRLGNAAVVRANNCLGIKGGAWDTAAGRWRLIPGIDVEWIGDSPADGVAEGAVPWRKFRSLEDCFAELVRMWNDRGPYEAFRTEGLEAFEGVYAPVPGHVERVKRAVLEVTQTLRRAGLCDVRGRLVG